MIGACDLTRRGLFAAGAGFALASCAPERAAASPRRLVLLMLDGGADGLALAPPVGDPAYLGIRGGHAIASPLGFGEGFGLHPALANVAAMAAEGRVRLAPAAGVAAPTRSHFHDRDVLECGAADPRHMRSGWLNRAVSALNPAAPVQAVALETASSLVTAGPATVGGWSPGVGALDRTFAAGLTELYAGDPEFSALIRLSRAVDRMVEGAQPDGRGEPVEVVRARAAGRLLAEPDGPAAVFMRIEGFDTHLGQGADTGRLAGRLAVVDQALGALRAEAESAWAETAVVVFTEFGRTVSLNGSGGTDHGAGGAALLLGGAVRRGGLLGDWPGLGRLQDGRELPVSLDLRALFKGVLAEHWGLDARDLGRVFPDSAPAPALSGLIG